MINIAFKMRRSLRILTAITAITAWLNPASTLANGFGDLNIVSGIEAYSNNEPAIALRYFEDYLRRYPSGHFRPEVQFLAARAALKQSSPKRALEYLDQLKGHLPEIKDYILALRGQSYRALFQWQQVIDVWKQFEQEHQDSPLHKNVYYRLADAYFALGSLKEAKETYNEALARSPKSDEATLAKFNLAHIAELSSNYGEARELYQHFVYYRPSHPLSELADKKLNNLIAKGHAKPATFGLRLTKIDKLITRHSFDRARKEVKALKATSLSAEDQLGIAYREAKLLYRKGEYQKAIQIFEKLIQVYPGLQSVDYQKWIARTYSTSGEPKKAVAIYQKLAEQYQSRSTGRQALFMAAWLAFNGGEHKQAIELFELFLNRYPTDSRVPDVYWYKAWNLYRLRDFPQALKALQELRSTFPQSSLTQNAHYWEGRIQLLLGNSKAAKSSFLTAQSIAPYNYYGAWARQRISELASMQTPYSNDGKLIKLASLEVPTPQTDDASPVRTAEKAPLPTASNEKQQSAQAAQKVISWNEGTLEWDSPAGKRAILLLQLGMISEAANLVAILKPVSTFTATEIAYSRSVLFHTLGEHYQGFKLAEHSFRSILQQPLRKESRPYFEIAYPSAHTRFVNKAHLEFGLPRELLWSVMKQESAFNTKARSWASAAGLLQIIPSTGRKIASALSVDPYNFATLQDPKMNIRFGAWYLTELIRKFDGNFILAVASYNAGPKAVSSWVDKRHSMDTDEFIEEIPYRQTRHYVRKILGNLAVYHQLYQRQPLEIPTAISPNYLDNIDF